MSQKSPSDHRITQSDFLPKAPKNNTQEKTQDHSPITDRPRVSVQDPLTIIHTRRVSIQEPPIIHSHQVSIQGPRSIIHSHQVSIKEIPSSSNSGQASIQETPSTSNSRLVSIQEMPPINNSHQGSTKDTSSIISSRWANIQDKPSAIYSCHFTTRDVSSIFQTRHFSVQNPPLITHVPLTNIESVAYTGHFSFQDQPPNCSSHLGIQVPKSPIWAKVSVPSTITHSPDASSKSSETVLSTSEDFKDPLDSSQLNEHTLGSNIHSLPSGNSVESNSSRFKCRHSQLPIGWRLLYEAKKTSRQLSLLLSLAGMVIIGLITLDQPWIHFQVPLTAPGDHAGPLTIPINTVFFVQCSDISCLHEYDQNAYLLDFAWASLLFSTITSFCLCMILINIVFTSSNLPMLDFSNFIISTLTGTSMILGVLFYLMQAHEYLQEGMTYRLGHSFYLAWAGIFFFLMTGFFSYLNYMNFWSILALQAIWT